MTTPYLAEQPNRYVGLGYWQSNRVASGTQDTLLTAFAFGFGTSAADMPRTGSAQFQTDVVGFLAEVGRELRVIQGLGTFNVDFAAATFRAQTYPSENTAVSDQSTSGGMRFLAGGKIDSSGAFNGLLVYQGMGQPLNGTINGKFYGPGAAELGASFIASNATSHLTGALTGQRWRTDINGAVNNATLTDIFTSESLLPAVGGELRWTAVSGQPGFSGITASAGGGRQVTVGPGGALKLEVGDSLTDLQTAQIVPGQANFTTWPLALSGQYGGRRRSLVAADQP